jgi:hypothetical protein
MLSHLKAKESNPAEATLEQSGKSVKAMLTASGNGFGTSQNNI